MSTDVIGFLNDANALINAKLSKIYTTPVSGAPLLEVIEADIAIYRLMTRRMLSSEQANKSDWPDRYKEAMDLLDQIAEGSISLTGSDGTAIPTNPNVGVMMTNTQDFVPTFAEDGELGSEIDPQKIERLRALRT